MTLAVAVPMAAAIVSLHEWQALRRVWKSRDFLTRHDKIVKSFWAFFQTIVYTHSFFRSRPGTSALVANQRAGFGGGYRASGVRTRLYPEAMQDLVGLAASVWFESIPCRLTEDERIHPVVPYPLDYPSGAGLQQGEGNVMDSSEAVEMDPSEFSLQCGCEGSE